MPLLATSITAKIIVFMCTLTMCGLGVWQLYRADVKTQRLAQITQNQQASAYHLNQVLQSSDPRDMPVRTHGYMDKQRYFLIDNKLEEGRLGYHVVVPVQTDDGQVLVNFGWIQGAVDKQQLPDVSLPDGDVMIEGMISVPALNPFISETQSETVSTWPVVLQQVDIDRASKILNMNLLPVMILMAPDDSQAYARKWQPVVMPPEKHIAYAVQWFGLAIACMAVFVAASRKVKKDTQVE